MDAWLVERGHEKGAVLDLGAVWELAKAWYRGRLDPDWRGRSAGESRAVLEDLGLVDDFWALP